VRQFLFAIDADVPVVVCFVVICFVVLDDVLVISDTNEWATADGAARS
jgi:hypothetical protein